MNKKSLQKDAVSLSFNRNAKDDWEILATEQFDEKLISKVRELEGEIKNRQDIVSIDPNKCCNWRFSDRSEFELGDIDDLAEDIKNNGQLQPAIVREVNSLDYEYEIIGGERRWRACKRSGVDLKAIIVNKDDLDCMVIQTSENKKHSLSPYSLAKAYLKMMDELNISQNELSKRLGIPKSSFGDLMSFNKVPQRVWDEVSDASKVSPTTAAFLSKVCGMGEIYIEAVIKLAKHIREGVGVKILQNLIEKSISNSKVDRNETFVCKDDSGSPLFRITSAGRISITKSVLTSLDIKELSEHLKKYICDKS